MTIKSLFEKAPSKFDGDKWGDGDAVIHFNLSGPEGGAYTASIKARSLRIDDGLIGTPNLTISLAVNDLEALLDGSLKPFQAVISGKIQMDGDKMLALKALQVFGI